jgi:hypothetical protein
MKTVAIVFQVFIFTLLLVGAGCEPAAVELPAPTGSSSNLPSAYAPAKVDIMPLTEFVTAGDALDALKLKVYVSLLDPFDCQVKSPGVFRFELYEYVQRSAEPKGQRIIIWPDIDLTECSENNNHWRDFLRAYEFNLDFGPQRNQNCILQVTCLCPSGKRLSADFALKYAE